MSEDNVQVLRPSKAKWAAMGFFGALLLAGGAAALGLGWPDAKPVFLGILLIPSGIAVLAISAASVFSERCNLRLNGTGFTVGALFSAKRYEWAQVGEFRAGSIGGNKMVLFNFDDPQLAATASARRSASMCGCHACLPDTYGLGAERLAELMNSCREKGLAMSPSLPAAFAAEAQATANARNMPASGRAPMPWLAFLLSFLLPGAGLCYVGKWKWGILNLLLVLAIGMALAMILPETAFCKIQKVLVVAFASGSGMVARMSAERARNKA